MMILNVMMASSVFSLGLAYCGLHDLADLVSGISSLDSLELVSFEGEFRDLGVVVK